MMRMNSKSHAKGFTLLEAIVALVILSTSGIAMYSWLSVSLDGLRRVDDIVAFKQVSDDLDAFFNSVTLTSETEQVFMLNGYKVDWRAELMEPIQRGRNSSGAVNAYEIGLYQVDVLVSNSGNRRIGAYQTRVVGYKENEMFIQAQP